MSKSIICFKCKSKIEDRFSYCPYCGGATLKTPFKDECSGQNQAKGLGIVGYMLIIALFILGYGLLDLQGLIDHKENTDIEEKISNIEMQKSMPIAPEYISEDIQNSVLDAAPAEGENYSEMRISIPMQDSNENNRYYLTSHNQDIDFHTITYIRLGNESDSFGKMEINCTENIIRKTSVADQTQILSPNLDLGPWYTPTPDWTDQDIYNFICKT